MPIEKNFVVMTLIITAAIIVLAGAYCLALETFWLSGKGQVAVRPVQQNQAVDEPADWKTYSNTQAGFEFKYPNNMNAGEGGGGGAFTLALDVYNLDAEGRLKDIAVSLDLYSKSTVKSFGWENRESGDNQTVVKNNNGDMMLITLTGKNYKDVYNNIVSTFKFIDSGLINTSDWKTHRDEKYGFECMVPADYNSFRVEEFESAELLKEYVQKIWQLNKDDVNSNITNKSLSNLVATKIDGRDAFSFNLTRSFVWPYGGRVIEGERVFIFTANKQGTIFLIEFPANDRVSQEILKTFKINEDWITPKIIAGEWKRYSSLNGFSFEYPSNIFNAEQAKDNSVFFSSKHGQLVVKIVDKKLDPNNIEGMYGKIEKPEIIKVGEKIGYKYGWGDAGCEATIVETALATSTLFISFGSCSDDLYYLAQDNDLQGKILSTFKFTE